MVYFGCYFWCTHRPTPTATATELDANMPVCYYVLSSLA